MFTSDICPQTQNSSSKTENPAIQAATDERARVLLGSNASALTCHLLSSCQAVLASSNHNAS